MNKHSLVRAIKFGRSLLWMLLLMIVAHPAAFAQTRKITGKVSTSDNGTLLSGVTVKIKGTNLTITSVGYSAQDVPVNNNTTLTIKMVADPQSMQQVVIVGYGAVKRKDL